MLRKGALDNDIPDALVSLSLLRFPASFWMFKQISVMGPANWIWIPIKEKKRKKKHTQNYMIQGSLYPWKIDIFKKNNNNNNLALF